MSNFLVRIYHPQKDKQNIYVDTLTQALKVLDKLECQVYKKVDWCNCTDYFLIGTNDYIREIKTN